MITSFKIGKKHKSVLHFHQKIKKHFFRTGLVLSTGAYLNRLTLGGLMESLTTILHGGKIQLRQAIKSSKKSKELFAVSSDDRLDA